MTRDEAELLNSANDDAYGLWEVDWWFNSNNPQQNREQRIALLQGLIEQRLIDVFFGPVPLGPEHEPIDASAALKAIRVADNWLPPELHERPVYHVMTNAKGEAAERVHAAR